MRNLERLAFSTDPDRTTREVWLARHCRTLADTLELPNINGVEQRIYRARYWVDDELVVATMLQRFAGTGSSLSIMVVRGFHHFPSATARLDLSGRYSRDEIAAFLRLDIVNPDDLTWIDETGYIVVATSASELLRRMND